jgi:hypothetical protein
LSNNIELQQTDGTTVITIWNGTLLADEQVNFGDDGHWIVLSSAGVPKMTSFVGPVDVQTFTSSGANTWTKPTSFTPKVVFVKLWGRDCPRLVSWRGVDQRCSRCHQCCARRRPHRATTHRRLLRLHRPQCCASRPHD